MLKELAVYLPVYNLVRLRMLQAAARQQVDVDRISFIDTARHLLYRMLGLPGAAPLHLRRRGGVHRAIDRLVLDGQLPSPLNSRST